MKGLKAMVKQSFAKFCIANVIIHDCCNLQHNAYLVRMALLTLQELPNNIVEPEKYRFSLWKPGHNQVQQKGVILARLSALHAK